MQLPAGTCGEDLERFGDLGLALSLQNFNQNWQIVAPWTMTCGISVKADTSSSNFIFSLPDNLFKPKERVIPEKEMHMRSKRYKFHWFKVCPWIFFLLDQLRFGQPCPLNPPFPAGSDSMGHPWHENQILSRSLMLNTQKWKAVRSLWIFSPDYGTESGNDSKI